MKVLLADRIDAGAAAQLHLDHDVVDVADEPMVAVAEAIIDREALVVVQGGRRLTADIVSPARELRLVVRAGAGLDDIDVAHLRQRGIKLVRIPGPAAQAVAELAMGLMLALSRRVVDADRRMQLGHFETSRLIGSQVAGKTIGIVGAGNIGRRVGELALALGMKALGCIEHPSRLRERLLEEWGICLVSFDRVIEKADVVSLHVPLTPATRGMIDASTFARMRPGALLVNLSHGGIVDERALLDALVCGHLGGAAVDVHEVEVDGVKSPLAGLPNVILTPHIGAMAVETQREIGEQVVETLALWSSSLSDGSSHRVAPAAVGAADLTGTPAR